MTETTRVMAELERWPKAPPITAPTASGDCKHDRWGMCEDNCGGLVCYDCRHPIAQQPAAVPGLQALVKQLREPMPLTAMPKDEPPLDTVNRTRRAIASLIEEIAALAVNDAPKCEHPDVLEDPQALHYTHSCRACGALKDRPTGKWGPPYKPADAPTEPVCECSHYKGQHQGCTDVEIGNEWDMCPCGEFQPTTDSGEARS